MTTGPSVTNADAATAAAGGADADERRRLLSIYLNDHAAVGAAALDLARRAAGGHAGTPFGDLARSLCQELERHRDALGAVMDANGVRANPLKINGARLGERLGRLKLNGRVTSSSPLSAVVEAEALLGGVGSFVTLWRGLAELGDRLASPGVDAAALAASARERLGELEQRRLELLRAALAAG